MPSSIAKSQSNPVLQWRFKGVHPGWLTLEGPRFLAEVQETYRHLRDLSDIPQGQGQPIALISVAPLGSYYRLLRKFLQQIGYTVHDVSVPIWEANEELPASLDSQLETLAASEGPLILLGHSFAGLWVQRFAQKHPEMITQSVTVGTPQLEGNDASETHHAIWSDSDGFVAPQALPGTADTKVRSSHVGMPFNWNVFQALATLLHHHH